MSSPFVATNAPDMATRDPVEPRWHSRGLTRRAMLAGLAAMAMRATLDARETTLNPGACGANAVKGFDSYCFADSKGGRHQIYVADGGGPPVILLHELPGLTDDDLAAATRLSQERYTVVAPLLFGEPGGAGHALSNANRLCGPTQFACNSGDTTSPHVAWLRELVGDVRRRWPSGKGVGVIGMCLTGSFPLALLREPAVVAPVLCQPTIPFNIWTRFGWFTDTSALGVSDGDLRHARMNRDVPVLGIRYQGDWRCRAERFNRLVREFPARFYRLDIPGNHHSTLGGDFCDHAYLEVTSFLNQQLRVTPDPKVAPFPRYAKAGVQQPVAAPPCGAPTHHAAT